MQYYYNLTKKGQGVGGSILQGESREGIYAEQIILSLFPNNSLSSFELENLVKKQLDFDFDKEYFKSVLESLIDKRLIESAHKYNTHIE